jgi:hypothetical protein
MSVVRTAMLRVPTEVGAAAVMCKNAIELTALVRTKNHAAMEHLSQLEIVPELARGEGAAVWRRAAAAAATGKWIIA